MLHIKGFNMTKKIILTIAILSSTLFAANDGEIIAYFKTQIPVPNVDIKIDSRIQIDGFEGMDYVTLHISDGTRVQKMSVFTKGDLIFPDVISIKDGGSIKETLDNKKLISSLAKLYKEESAENILMIGNDPKKETLVKFTDPECPFCAKEIANIEEKLKTHNLKLIFTPVHDRSSLEKSVLIYKQVNQVENIEEKIKIVKKYFAGDVDAKVTDDEVKKIEELRRKYFHAGLKGVPFYVSEKELLN